MLAHTIQENTYRQTFIQNCRKQQRYWRSWVGRDFMYDVIGASQFALLTLFFGLREQHKVLEIGSGTLRAARFLIPFLDPENYCGIEPNNEATKIGLQKEVGSIAEVKKPRFLNCSNFCFSQFEERFDFVLSYSVFTHIPPKDIQKVFTNLSDVVRPNTIFLASASISDNELIIDNEKWVDFPCNTYSLHRITEAANNAGFQILPISHIFQGWFVAYKHTAKIETIVEQIRRINWNTIITSDWPWQ